MTRAASPASPGAMAAMRSPSTATSAGRMGAPLPSTTEPFRMRRDQATSVGHVDDGHRLHAVADRDAVHHVHPLGDLPEDGVLPVEERRGLEGYVELAARRIRVLRPRHGH